MTRVQTGFNKQSADHRAPLGIHTKVVHREPDIRGFHVVQRWVIERSLGQLMLHRRLARDYETPSASSEAMIHFAMIDNTSKHITHETTPTWRGMYNRYRGKPKRPLNMTTQRDCPTGRPQ